MRFLTVCSPVKHKQLFYAYIRQNLVHMVDLDIPQEYDRILQKALTPLAWAEDYHIQALSLILNMPIFSYNVWRNGADIFYNDPTMLVTSWQVVLLIDVRAVTIMSCIVHQVTTL